MKRNVTLKLVLRDEQAALDVVDSVAAALDQVAKLGLEHYEIRDSVGGGRRLRSGGVR